MPFLLPLYALWREAKVLSLIGFILFVWILIKITKTNDSKK